MSSQATHTENKPRTWKQKAGTGAVILIVCMIIVFGGGILRGWFGFRADGTPTARVGPPKNYREVSNRDTKDFAGNKHLLAREECDKKYYVEQLIDLKTFQECVATATIKLNYEEAIANNPLPQTSAQIQTAPPVIIQAPPTPTTLPQTQLAPVETPLPPPLTTIDCSNASSCVKNIGNGEYDVTVDPRIMWMNTGIRVRPGDCVEFIPDQSSLVLSPPEKPIGPQGGKPVRQAAKPEDFPVQEAWTRGLVAKFSNESAFGIPTATIKIPQTESFLLVMANVKTAFLNEASGNFRVKINVRKP